MRVRYALEVHNNISLMRGEGLIVGSAAGMIRRAGEEHARRMWTGSEDLGSRDRYRCAQLIESGWS